MKVQKDYTSSILILRGLKLHTLVPSVCLFVPK
jgi:hypothetical protein